MKVISKAQLADELKISRARVSQYVKRGLPVRSDGKLDRSEALNWLNRSTVGLKSFEDKGSNRAQKLSKVAKPKPAIVLPADELEIGDEARTALVAAIDRIEAVVAYAVVAAGGTAEVAFCTASIARLEFMDVAADHLDEIGARWVEPDNTLGPVEPTHLPPDWPSLAGLADEPVAIDRWRKAERRRPYWADVEPDEPPHPWLEKAP